MSLLSAAARPRWELIYQNDGDNVTGDTVGDVAWSTDGSSIGAVSTSGVAEEGWLVVAGRESLPAVHLRFDAALGSGVLGVGLGPDSDATNPLAKGVTALVDAPALYTGRLTMRGYVTNTAFRPTFTAYLGTYFTVDARLIGGTYFAFWVNGAYLGQGSVDTSEIIGSVRLGASDAEAVAAASATRLRNIKVWKNDLLGELPT